VWEDQIKTELMGTSLNLCQHCFKCDLDKTVFKLKQEENYHYTAAFESSMLMNTLELEICYVSARILPIYAFIQEHFS
jgi:hypothetical protein